LVAGSALYRNNGNGTFANITDSWGLGGDRDWPTSAAFADLDNDGDLDLYVCHYLKYNPADPAASGRMAGLSPLAYSPLMYEAVPDHLFRNDGGRFVDVSQEAGIADSEGRGLGVVACDLDDDGRVDLFVANDLTANVLYLNRGGLRFEETGHKACVAASSLGGYQAGMGIVCDDFDGDGRPDLAVTNFFGSRPACFTTRAADCSLTCPPSQVWAWPAATALVLARRSSIPVTLASSIWRPPTATSSTTARQRHSQCRPSCSWDQPTAGSSTPRTPPASSGRSLGSPAVWPSAILTTTAGSTW
jgi:FG-GAP-like repeat